MGCWAGNAGAAKHDPLAPELCHLQQGHPEELAPNALTSVIRMNEQRPPLGVGLVTDPGILNGNESGKPNDRPASPCSGNVCVISVNLLTIVGLCERREHWFGMATEVQHALPDFPVLRMGVRDYVELIPAVLASGIVALQRGGRQSHGPRCCTEMLCVPPMLKERRGFRISCIHPVEGRSQGEATKRKTRAAAIVTERLDPLEEFAAGTASAPLRMHVQIRDAGVSARNHGGPESADVSITEGDVDFGLNPFGRVLQDTQEHVGLDGRGLSGPKARIQDAAHCGRMVPLEGAYHRRSSLRERLSSAARALCPRRLKRIVSCRILRHCTGLSACGRLLGKCSL